MGNAEFLMVDKRVQRARIAEKRALVLQFLASEGYSTALLLGRMLGLSRSAVYRTLTAMQRDGLVQLDYVQYAPGSRGTQSVWGLTAQGALLAADPADEHFSVDYYETGRIAPVSMAHHLAVQGARVNALAAGWTTWTSGRGCYQLAERDRGRWPKVPDALTRSPAGRVIAVELERTIKTPKRYQAILGDYAGMMHARTIDEVHYLCQAAVVPRLQRLFDAVVSVRVRGQVLPVPEAVRRRLRLFAVDQWPPGDG